MSERVYIIGAPDGGPVKIGYSKDPDSRLKSIQTGNHRPLSVLATRRGGKKLEAQLSQRFATFHVRGEWFDLPKAELDGLLREFSPEPHQEINWRCDVCGKPVADGSGYVTVDYAAAVGLAVERKRLRRYPRLSPQQGRVRMGRFSLDDLQVATSDAKYVRTWDGARQAILVPAHESRPNVEWRCLHGQCDPRPDTLFEGYAIERVRTPWMVIARTIHMMEKSWLGATNWPGFVWHHVLSERKTDA